MFQWLFILEDQFFTLYLCLLKENKILPRDTSKTFSRLNVYYTEQYKLVYPLQV